MIVNSLSGYLPKESRPNYHSQPLTKLIDRKRNAGREYSPNGCKILNIIC